MHSRSYAALVERIARMAKLPHKGFLKFGCAFIGGTKSDEVDLYHFFNQIGTGLCRKPFVTTFETAVPRISLPCEYWYQKQIEALVSSRCRRLLALSDCARRIQLQQLKIPDVSMKLTVLHPPQETLITQDELAQKWMDRDKSLKFFFVGRDFFHKGGGEILRAFLRLREIINCELFLVGDMSRHDYIDLPSVDDTSKHLRIVDENKWIHYFSSLPNEKVLALMKTCDVGLLPTRADTYGYSVLEMQACGLPVITTDVRALPEINNDQCGWVIKGCGVRDGSMTYGEADYSSPEKLYELSKKIELGICDTCKEIASKPSSVREKGVCALKRILLDHNPKVYGKRLSEIYKEALG